MNKLMKWKISCQRYMSCVIVASLTIFSMMASVVVQAKNSDTYQFHGKSNDQHKQHRYGDNYRAYKKKYKGNRHYAHKRQHHKNDTRKYDYPKDYTKKRQHHHNNSDDNSRHYTGNNYRQHYKPLRPYRRHTGFKANYWSAHKRHGYQYRRVAKHHYYYNNRGFYFPGLGLVEHAHQHNDNCDEWHFSALLASSILLSIYHK
jgi:hypothetical protein